MLRGLGTGSAVRPTEPLWGRWRSTWPRGLPELASMVGVDDGLSDEERARLREPDAQRPSPLDYEDEIHARMPPPPLRGWRCPRVGRLHTPRAGLAHHHS